MEIDLIELKKIVNRLLDHIIETRGVRSITLGKNYYWDIPTPEIYEVEEEPGKLDTGSLSDDWEFISSLLNPDSAPVAYQLTEVAPIIRYIGELLGEKFAQHGG